MIPMPVVSHLDLLVMCDIGLSPREAPSVQLWVSRLFVRARFVGLSFAQPMSSFHSFTVFFPCKLFCLEVFRDSLLAFFLVFFPLHSL